MAHQKTIPALQAALLAEPDNTQHAWSLALAYRDAGQFDHALSAFERRSHMAGFDQEVYAALLQAARMAVKLGRNAGEVIDRFLRAWEFRPTRVEALGELAFYLREHGPRWQLGYLLASRAIETPETSDVAFVEPEWQQWRCLDEFAVSAYWVGRFEQSREACERLLATPALPAAERKRVSANLEHALRKLGAPDVGT